MYTNIVSNKFYHSVTAGNAGENPFRVGVGKLFQRQVGGNQGGFPAGNPLVDAQKQLRRNKRVGQFGSQVIDDQKVTVAQIFFQHGICALVGPGECAFGQLIEEIEGGEIDHAVGAVDQFFGDTVGEKGFSYSRVSVEKQVGERSIKGLNELSGGGNRAFERSPGRSVR